MNLIEYLRGDAEPIPRWLESYSKDSRFRRADFFGSRVVVYPGSGNDGHAVRTFGKAGAAHCFLYVDYMVPEEEIRQRLDDPDEGFRGYRASIIQNLAEPELSPRGWVPHIRPRQYLRPVGPRVPPYALLAVLDREEGLNEDHGPRRLAVVFLAGDGHASFDALFCQRDSAGPPYAMLLQDHGFGGDYSLWGSGGVVHQIAVQEGVFPSLLFVADGTVEWDGYRLIPEVEADIGGVWANRRRLYEHQAVG